MLCYLTVLFFMEHGKYSITGKVTAHDFWSLLDSNV